MTQLINDWVGFRMSREIENVIQSRESCIYTKCYCEENVWKLCDLVRNAAPHLLKFCFAVFLSNHQRAVPIWQQKASQEPNKYVIWDYHVILLYKDATSCLIYDLDTRLDFPCDLDSYIKHAIGSEQRLPPPFHRLFRVITGEDYLRHFASDRSHMVKEDGTWQAAPPTYPPIQSTDSTNNLEDFISMELGVGWGDVLNLSELIHRLSPTLTDVPSLL